MVLLENCLGMHMIKYLPQIKDIEPIVGTRSTFGETIFCKQFSLLNNKEKLEIMCSLVKQTMIYNKYPNPATEFIDLIGDDYTAAVVLSNYLDSLDLFPRKKIVMVNNRKIDVCNYYGYHFAILVYEDDRTYLVDATPDVGLGIGRVTDLCDNDIYRTYIFVDSDMKNNIGMFRKCLYCIKYNICEQQQIESFNYFRKMLNNEQYAGMLMRYYETIFNSQMERLKEIAFREYNDKIKNITKIQRENNDKLMLYNDKLINKIYSETSLKLKQEYAQIVIGNIEKKACLSFASAKINLNNITPRLLWELGYTVIILKPSSFYADISNTVFKIMIPNADNLILSYDCNLGKRNSFYLNPMDYFHPDGYKYNTQMFGPNKVILVKDDPKMLNMRKHYIRDNFTQEYNGKKVIWYNNDFVTWDSQLYTNLVHSADDATESSVHLLANYPEYQSFTRFDYPNPVLRSKKNERRI